MQVIAIVNRKGGIGKTATAQALAAGLQRNRHKVLMIDLDSQTNLTYSTGAKAETDKNSLNLLIGGVDPRQLITGTPQGDIIAGSESLAGADTIITETGKEYRLKEALADFDYDYIIIDTPAALGILTINALTAANSVIIPVQADIYSLQGLSQLNNTIKTVQKYCNSGLTINGILLTRYNSRAILSRDLQAQLEKAAEQLNTKLYNTPIRECISIKEAQAMQQDIFTYASGSNAAKDYISFIKEFERGITGNGKKEL